MPDERFSSATVQEFCRERIRHFESKADHNKAEALRLFIVLIFCTLAAPLFITLGPGLLLGKLVPSVLSSLATGCTIWLQQRKPQQLWTLYRTTQRRLEREAVSFQFGIDEYETAADDAKLLVQRVALICGEANDLWAPMIPNPDKMIAAFNAEGGKSVK